MSNLSEFPFLKNIINIVLKEQNFKENYDIKISDGTNKGEGFLGEIYIVAIKDNDKQLNLIVKSAPKNKEIREQLNTKKLYKNEIYFYNNVIKTFAEFEKNVGVEQQFNSTAKFYGYSLNDTDDQLLCLENLKSQGFVVFEKNLWFNKKHNELVLKKFAHFHAFSYAFRDQKPNEYKKLTNKIHNMFTNADLEDTLFKSWADIFRNIYEYFEPTNDKKLLEKIKKYVFNCPELFFYCILDNNSKYTAVLHGDCWTNNMMFKYEKIDNETVPVDMKLIDFQLMCCGSPVNDLSFAFYTSANSDEYINLDNYLELYYKHFSKHVMELGSDPEKLYPYNRLKEEWKIYGKFGFMMGLLFQRIKLTPSDKIKDFTDLLGTGEDQNIFEGEYDKPAYEKWVKLLVLHLHEIDAL